MSPWWAGLPAAEATVACSGTTHTLRWEAGTLVAVDHDDPEAEATLAALAGEPARCLELLHAWRRRRDDPQVLTLGSRGLADPLDIATDPRTRQRLGAHPRAGREELIDLLALGGGLPDRLQAHTAATWTRRMRAGHSALPAAVPQLHAALYGRVLAALRLWLGDPGLAIELELIDPAGDRRLRRLEEGVAVALPFAWLSEVWARGLTTIFGRLCVGADTTDGIAWSLDTVGTDLRDRARLSVTLDAGRAQC
jgi:hypothetical protein